MKPLTIIALLAAAGIAAPALAQSPDVQAMPAGDPAKVDAAAILQPAIAAPPAVTAPTPRRSHRSPMLTDDELGTLRGGEQLTITNQQLTAITSGNVFNGDYAAGAVTLSDFALSNFNGVGNLLINTGAQVSAQSAMNLTINLAN